MDETLNVTYKKMNSVTEICYLLPQSFSRVPQNKKTGIQNKHAYKVGQLFTSVLVTTCYILV